MAEATVVFADLTGSTGAFETLGNVKATWVITRLTQWIGEICRHYDGRVVKNLGDGVLMLFAHNADAVSAAVELQRLHATRMESWPEALRMGLKIGLACGDVVDQDGDCFGDAVNVASRLSDLSGSAQIFASLSVIEHLPLDGSQRTRCLGALDLRGRSEACVVYRIEWQTEVPSEYMTLPGALISSPTAQKVAAQSQTIHLSWKGIHAAFASNQLPVFLGRDTDCHFIVDDPRVSRRHASISCRAGRFYLQDISSYGTWVRFSDGASVIALRRQECVLMPEAEIALGGPLEGDSVATLRFAVKNASPKSASATRGFTERT